MKGLTWRGTEGIVNEDLVDENWVHDDIDDDEREGRTHFDGNDDHDDRARKERHFDGDTDDQVDIDGVRI